MMDNYSGFGQYSDKSYNQKKYSAKKVQSKVNMNHIFRKVIKIQKKKRI